MKDEIREVIAETAKTAAKEAIKLTGGTRDYYKATESLLYNYQRLRDIAADQDGYMDEAEVRERSRSISHAAHAGGGIRDAEDMRRDIEEARAKSYIRTRARLNEIEAIVKHFGEEPEFAVVRMYYFGEDARGNRRPSYERATFEQIAYELTEYGLPCCERTARKWRARYVADMAICLFGTAAAVDISTRKSSGSVSNV